MKLSFDDLVGKQYLTSFEVNLPGVGVVDIHQISASQASDIVLKMNKLDGDKLEDFIAFQSAKFVKGSDPSKAEIQSMRDNLTAKTISKIFYSGLQSSAPSVENLEEAEKN